jgi:rubrerythrin
MPTGTNGSAARAVDVIEARERANGGSPRAPEEPFDLDRYLRASKRVDLSGVAWDRVAAHPLSAAEARILTYMMDIESHTVVFLRDVLATRSALDPEITAFLSCWVYEELWHGEAFSRFLGEAGWSLPPDRERVGADSAYPSRVARNSWIRRAVGGKGSLAHVATMAASLGVRDFPAVHMTWGAVNELSTLTAYHRVIATTRHPVLVDVLTRIIKDERRHFAFYRAQARRRLASSRTARRVTRWTLEHLWAPVGTGVRPQAETDFAVATVFGPAEAREAVAAMDRTIEALPGLEGLGLYRRAVGEAVRRLGRSARQEPG